MIGPEWLAVLDSLQTAFSGTNPIIAGVVFLVIFAFRKGWITVPAFFQAKAKPADPVDPQKPDPLPLPDDLNGDGVIQPWEDLLSRLKKRLADRFAAKMQGGATEEDVFHELHEKLKS